MLDIQIQGDTNGIVLAKHINEKYHLPFVFLTAHSDPKTVKSAIETKPFGYLLKPFNSVDIYTSIEVALRNFESINRAKEGEDFSIVPNPNDSLIFIDDQLFIKEESPVYQNKCKGYFVR